MFCVNCGAKVSPKQSFCTKCGLPQSKEVELVNEGGNLNTEIIKDNEINTDIGYRKSNFTIESNVKKRESRLGILSLVISIFTATSLFILFVLAIVLPSESNSYADQAEVETTLGFIYFLIVFIDFFAIGLGIAGINRRSRSRLTAFFGTIISVATLIIMISWLAIGILIDL